MCVFAVGALLMAWETTFVNYGQSPVQRRNRKQIEASLTGITDVARALQ